MGKEVEWLVLSTTPNKNYDGWKIWGLNPKWIFPLKKLEQQLPNTYFYQKNWSADSHPMNIYFFFLLQGFRIPTGSRMRSFLEKRLPKCRSGSQTSISWELFLQAPYFIYSAYPNVFVGLFLFLKKKETTNHHKAFFWNGPQRLISMNMKHLKLQNIIKQK